MPGLESRPTAMVTVNMDSNFYYFSASDVSARMVPDEGAVLFKADTGREKVINQTGALVWERLDGARAVADIAEELFEFFDGVSKDRLVTDVHEFLHELEDEGRVDCQPVRLSREKREEPFLSLYDAPKWIH